ncbi:MAG: SprT-like domain-containing protein [Simkaniaceae bacterium]|nr:SprT-like domain-containing protein [Simkaniaceae bacterium]
MHKILHSKTLIAFRKYLAMNAIKILSFEMSCRISRKRFTRNNYSYPLNINVFEHKTKLGYFNSDLLEIGINKGLVDHEELCLNVLRHELVHYLVHIDFGDVEPHGVEFKQMCQELGYGPEIHLASTPLMPTSQETPTLLRKIEKLFALSESANSNESASALLKANELLERHGLSRQDPHEIVLHRSLNYRQGGAKIESIAEILRAFRVETVINHGRNSVYLEILGSEQDVQNADYVAAFLDKEMERLWNRETDLKGKRSKNAFFRGLAQGYLKELPKERGLIPTHAHLVSLAYPRLGKRVKSFTTCENAEKAGKKAGADLSIRKPVGTRPPHLLN